MKGSKVARDDALTLRLNVGKMTSGNLFVVKKDEGLGEWMAFEERDVEISNPVSPGRYYAHMNDGQRAVVLLLEEDEEEEDGYQFLLVANGGEFFDEALTESEIERMIGDELSLLERVDRAAGG